MNQRTITVKVTRLITGFVSVCLTALALLVAYWSSQPSIVLEVKNDPVPVSPAEVNSREKVFLTIDFCKHIGTRGTVELNLIGETGGAKIAVNRPDDTTGKQCVVYPEVPVSVPGQTPPDTYHAEYTVCYDVNPLKKDRCTVFRSQSFKVTTGTGAATQYAPKKPLLP